jgi:protein subunit release factor A
VADYPKQVLPDLHLIKLFRDIELLKENCEQRNLMVDVNQLASDYQRWQQKKKEYRRLRDLHHIQEKLRAQQQQQQSTDDLSMTDTNETDMNKMRKKKGKPISTATAATTEETTPVTEIK